MPLVRPQLRGVLHLVGFVVACLVGSVFVSFVNGRRLVGAAVFAGSAATMLGASALYHRVTWKPRARMWMRRLDHAGIYLLIAGTYTPVGLLSMHGVLQRVVLAVVWSGAGVAILAKFCWVRSPKWVSAGIAVALGWVGIAAMPQLARRGRAGSRRADRRRRPGVHRGRGRLRSPKPDPVPRSSVTTSCSTRSRSSRLPASTSRSRSSSSGSADPSEGASHAGHDDLVQRREGSRVHQHGAGRAARTSRWTASCPASCPSPGARGRPSASTARRTGSEAARVSDVTFVTTADPRRAPNSQRPRRATSSGGTAR